MNQRKNGLILNSIDRPFYSFTTYIKEMFSELVYKVSVDYEFTCPNRDGTKGFGGCLYCDEEGSSARTKKFSSLRAQVKNNIEFRSGQKGKPKKFIIFLQSYSNTYLKIDLLRKIYEEAVLWGEEERIVGLAISTRPDLVTQEIFELLMEFRLKFPYVALEVGMQSIYNKSLQFYERQEEHHDFLKVIQMAKDFPLIEFVPHLILGSPVESREEMIKMASYLSTFDGVIKGIKLHLFSILKGTKAEKWFLKTRDGDLFQSEIETKEMAVDLLVDFLEHLSPKIVIHRLGGHGYVHHLLHPLWLKEESGRLPSFIRDEFRKRGSFQGSKIKV